MRLNPSLRKDLVRVIRAGFIEARTLDDVETAIKRTAEKWYERKKAERGQWLGVVQKMEPHRKKVEAKSRKILREMKNACLRKLRKDTTFKVIDPERVARKEAIIFVWDKKTIDDIVAVFDTSRRRWQTMSGEIGDAVSDAGDRSMELLGLDIAFDNLDPAVVDWIENRGLELATSVTGTVKEEIRAILQQGVQDGLTTGQIGDQISAYFDEGEAWKADRIARTEINAAQAEASSEAYRQSGVVTSKEWVAAPDACDDCAEEDGVEYDLDADDIPLHPN